MIESRCHTSFQFSVIFSFCSQQELLELRVGACKSMKLRNFESELLRQQFLKIIVYSRS